MSCMVYHRSYTHNLSSCKIKAWKKIQAWTGFTEVMGSNPIQAWIFFQALISQLLKLCV